MNENKNLDKLLETLLNRGQECEWIEFKENYCEPQKIGEYLSALANSSILHGVEYGYLIFGVKDKSLEVVGTSFSLKKRKKGGRRVRKLVS